VSLKSPKVRQLPVKLKRGDLTQAEYEVAIWEEPDNFSQRIANFQTHLETLKPRVNNQQPKLDIIEVDAKVIQTCLDCHSTYRVRQP